jgi:Protein of unknown function (DUF3617)
MSKRLLCAAAALVLQIAIVRAADPPEVQEGLWEVHGQTIENPGNKTTVFTYQLCRSHAYDKAMDALVKNVKGCSTEFDSVGGGRYTSASRCTVAGTLIVSKGTYTHESSTATRSESFATYTPPFHGKTDETVTQDQKYVGDCPAGVNPGDRIMADGSLQRYRP